MDPTQPAATLPVEDNWKYRRRVLFLSLSWIGVVMSAILIRGVDNALYDQAFIALAGSGATLLTAYIFGAVWDDHNRRSAYGSSYGGDYPYSGAPATTWRRPASSPPLNVEAPPAAEKPQPPPM